MSHKQIIAAFLVAIAPLAAADSWDSRDNINKATDRAIATYSAQGINGLVADSKNCFAGVDTSRLNAFAGRDIEYCIAFDMASTLIDQRRPNSTPATLSGYLNFNEVLMRGVLALEKARIVTLPEQIGPYFNRFANIQHKLPKKM